MTLLDDVRPDSSAPFDGVDVDEVDAAFALVVESLRASSPAAALPRVHRFQHRLDAVEADLLAAGQRAGASPADTERAAGRGSGRTTAEAPKAGPASDGAQPESRTRRPARCRPADPRPA